MRFLVVKGKMVEIYFSRESLCMNYSNVGERNWAGVDNILRCAVF
jgi:hypothetical protein